MTDDDHERQTAEQPSSWVTRFAPLIRSGGTVLDVACGLGRHARWMKARGWRTVAIDRNAGALASFPSDESLVYDLESSPWPFPHRTFDGIVVTNYLYRPLFAPLRHALASGAVLIYETFGRGQAGIGKPSNPAFLLEPGELLEFFAGMRIVAYEDGLLPGVTSRFVQRICVVNVNASDISERYRV